jgi:hypothetical protein
MEVVCQPHPPQVFLPTQPALEGFASKTLCFLGGGEKITADAYRVVGGKRYEKI